MNNLVVKQNVEDNFYRNIVNLPYLDIEVPQKEPLESFVLRIIDKISPFLKDMEEVRIQKINMKFGNKQLEIPSDKIKDNSIIFPIDRDVMSTSDMTIYLL